LTKPQAIVYNTTRMASEQVVYKGRTFHVQSNGKYYQDGNHNGLKGERLLHRLVWTEHHGPIKPHTSIHHKDGNWRNNSIKNLEAVPTSEHCSHHMRERFLNPEYRRKNKISLNKAIAAAPEWHASPEGLAWHKTNGHAVWKSVAKLRTHKCVFCKKTFRAKTIQSKLKFCSQSCTNKHVWRTKLVTKTCPECKVKFDSNKYSNTTTCSRSCGKKRFWRLKKRSMKANS